MQSFRSTLMIVTTRQVYSTVGIFIALLVATALFFALPSVAQSQTIQASRASASDHGRVTASGEPYDHHALTALHPFLPLNSMVRVTNGSTGRSVVVRINDRMQSSDEGGLRLSGAAADRIGLQEGYTAVQLRILDLESAAIAVGQTTDPPLEDEAPIVEPSPAYTLQIGSFSSLSSAEVMAKRYGEAWIREVPTDQGRVYKVFFSRFDSEGPARLTQDHLWSEGQDSFLRRIGA